MKRDLVSLADLSVSQFKHLMQRTDELRHGSEGPLRGQSVALLFQKPSLRTKVSFTVAVTQLGGSSLYLGPDEVGLGKRESTADVARVLSRYVQAIVFRAFDHSDVETLARYASVPVINALSDAEHPCQALATLYTIRQRSGNLKGKVIAFIGDGNNVAASLAIGAAMAGCHFRIASPLGYELPLPIMAKARSFAKETGATLEQITDPFAAVKMADVVYTDVWTSMGQEKESEVRRNAFQGYQVDERLFNLAKPDAIFLHPLPAHRGEEVSGEVMEHPRSAVFDEAENRLHVQKAVLMDLLSGDRTAG